MTKILAVLLALLLPVLASAGRNGGGTYTLPSGVNPVQSGQPITSSWANTTLNDIQTELTDSLSRSGKGGMSASLQLVAGSSSSPSFSWTAETNSGIYRNGAGDFRLSIGSVDAARWTASAYYVPAVWALTAASLTLKGQVVDGAGNVGIVLDNINALSNATARMVSFRSNNAEKAQVRADGSFITDGSLYTTGGVELVNRYYHVGTTQNWSFATPYTIASISVGANETWEIQTVFYAQTLGASDQIQARVDSTSAFDKWAITRASDSTTFASFTSGGTAAVASGWTGQSAVIFYTSRFIIRQGASSATWSVKVGNAVNTANSNSLFAGSYVMAKRIN